LARGASAVIKAPCSLARLYARELRTQALEARWLVAPVLDHAAWVVHDVRDCVVDLSGSCFGVVSVEDLHAALCEPRKVVGRQPVGRVRVDANDVEGAAVRGLDLVETRELAPGRVPAVFEFVTLDDKENVFFTADVEIGVRIGAASRLAAHRLVSHKVAEASIAVDERRENRALLETKIETQCTKATDVLLVFDDHAPRRGAVWVCAERARVCAHVSCETVGIDASEVAFRALAAFDASVP
jgi:hypothetical protein